MDRMILFLISKTQIRSYYRSQSSSSFGDVGEYAGLVGENWDPVRGVSEGDEGLYLWRDEKRQ